jgi:hypothetical protein
MVFYKEFRRNFPADRQYHPTGISKEPEKNNRTRI